MRGKNSCFPTSSHGNVRMKSYIFQHRLDFHDIPLSGQLFHYFAFFLAFLFFVFFFVLLFFICIIVFNFFLFLFFSYVFDLAPCTRYTFSSIRTHSSSFDKLTRSLSFSRTSDQVVMDRRLFVRSENHSKWSSTSKPRDPAKIPFCRGQPIPSWHNMSKASP